MRRILSSLAISSAGFTVLLLWPTPSHAVPKGTASRLCSCSCSFTDNNGKLQTGRVNDFGYDSCNLNGKKSFGFACTKGNLITYSYTFTDCRDLGEYGSGAIAQPPGSDATIDQGGSSPTNKLPPVLLPGGGAATPGLTLTPAPRLPPTVNPGLPLSPAPVAPIATPTPLPPRTPPVSAPMGTGGGTTQP